MTINNILATLLTGCTFYLYFMIKKRLYNRKISKIKDNYNQILSEIANEFDTDIRQLKTKITEQEATIMREDGFSLNLNPQS